MSQDADHAKSLYNSHAEEYFSDIGNDRKMRYIRKFAEQFFIQVKGKKILFAGCGDGLEAAVPYKAGAKIVGIDISEKCIELAKRKFPDQDFSVADIEKIPYPDKAFDMLFCSLAVMYKENLDGVFKEFSRVLKPKGLAIIVVPHPVYKAVRYCEMDYFDTGKKKEIWSGHERFNYYRTMEEYVNSLIGSGFTLERLYEPPVPKEFSPTPGHIPPFAIFKAVKE